MTFMIWSYFPAARSSIASNRPVLYSVVAEANSYSNPKLSRNARSRAFMCAP